MMVEEKVQTCGLGLAAVTGSTGFLFWFLLLIILLHLLYYTPSSFVPVYARMIIFQECRDHLVYECS